MHVRCTAPRRGNVASSIARPRRAAPMERVEFRPSQIRSSFSSANIGSRSLHTAQNIHNIMHICANERVQMQWGKPASSSSTSFATRRSFAPNGPANQLMKVSKRYYHYVLYRRVNRPSDSVPPTQKLVENTVEANKAHAAIQEYIGASDYYMAMRVFNNLRANGILPTPSTYKSMLSVFHEMADLDAMNDVYTEMVNNGIQVDITVLRMLLDANIIRARVQQAEHFFEQIKQHTPTDQHAYQRMLEMYILCRDKDKAKKCFEEMQNFKLEVHPQLEESYKQLLTQG